MKIGFSNSLRELQIGAEVCRELEALGTNLGGARHSNTAAGIQNFNWDAAENLLMDSASAYIYAGGGAPAEQVISPPA